MGAMNKKGQDYKTLALFVLIVIILVIIGKFVGWW